VVARNTAQARGSLRNVAAWLMSGFELKCLQILAIFHGFSHDLSQITIASTYRI